MDPPSKIKHEEANLEEMKTDQLPEKNVNNETKLVTSVPPFVMKRHSWVIPFLF